MVKFIVYFLLLFFSQTNDHVQWNISLRNEAVLSCLGRISCQRRDQDYAVAAHKQHRNLSLCRLQESFKKWLIPSGSSLKKKGIAYFVDFFVRFFVDFNRGDRLFHVAQDHI